MPPATGRLCHDPLTMFSTGRPASGSMPSVIGLVALAVIAVVYPVVAPATQNPLAVFVIPVLIVAALGTWRETAIIGAGSFAVAWVEGALQSDLERSGLAARLGIIAVSWGVAVAVAAERERRLQIANEAAEHALLMSTFASSLVPVPDPPPFADVAVRFRPGDERLRLGGDFFDAIRLPDGSLGYVVGDVCGHGPRAAALGAAVRAGWRAVAHRDPTDPAVWARVLDEVFFAEGSGDQYVTINSGRLDADSLELRYVSCGHPWPILVGEQATQLVPNVNRPLGIRRGPPFAVSTATIPPGATLVVFTDGLYENLHADRRRRSEADVLRYVGARPPIDLDSMLDHFGPDGFDDDVAVLAIGVPATRAATPDGRAARTTIEP